MALAQASPWPPCPLLLVGIRNATYQPNLVSRSVAIWPIVDDLLEAAGGFHQALGPRVAIVGGEVGLAVWWRLLHHGTDGGCGDQAGCRHLLRAFGLLEKLLILVQVGRALGQQVVVGAADLLPILHNGQDAGSLGAVLALRLDDLGGGVLGVKGEALRGGHGLPRRGGEAGAEGGALLGGAHLQGHGAGRPRGGL